MLQVQGYILVHIAHVHNQIKTHALCHDPQVCSPGGGDKCDSQRSQRLTQLHSGVQTPEQACAKAIMCVHAGIEEQCRVITVSMVQWIHDSWHECARCTCTEPGLSG
jgi:hypothetical protein